MFFVVPDYYEKRPKKCMNGWGSVFLTITPDVEKTINAAVMDAAGLDLLALVVGS